MFSTSDSNAHWCEHGSWFEKHPTPAITGHEKQYENADKSGDIFHFNVEVARFIFHLCVRSETTEKLNVGVFREFFLVHLKTNFRRSFSDNCRISVGLLLYDCKTINFLTSYNLNCGPIMSVFSVKLSTKLMTEWSVMENSTTKKSFSRQRFSDLLPHMNELSANKSREIKETW